MKTTTRFLQILFWITGIGILAFTFYSIDLKSLIHLLAQLKVNLLIVLLMYPFFALIDVLGWFVLFAKEVRHQVRFATLYLIRMAGESINFLTPFADVGGEYLKVNYCARMFGFSKRYVFAVIFVERTALFVSEAMFWFVGLLPLCLYLPVPDNIKVMLTAATLLMLVLILLLLAAQKKGLFTFVTAWVQKITPHSEFVNKWHMTFQDVDDELKKIYGSKDSRWVMSLAFHILGWILGGVEMYVIFKLLGVPVSFMNAMILEALLQLIRTSSFFIPGSLGVQEGLLALVTHSLGFESSVGVAVSLIKRFRQLIYVGIGFMCIHYLNQLIKPSQQMQPVS